MCTIVQDITESVLIVLFFYRKCTKMIKKFLSILSVMGCLMSPITSFANNTDVEIRNSKFTEEEITNRNGKTLIQCRLAVVGTGGGNAFYLDNFESVYIGYEGYRCQDIVEVVIIWNPQSNYDDDCVIMVNPVRTFGNFGGEKEEGLFV